ncbi:MAG TPA: PqqD family protein [Polyangiaceae bacterium]|nr:PqqD family protein [Polyangiaceae bacterium]
MTDRNSLAVAASPRQLRQSVRTASRVIDGKAVVITIDRNQLHVLNAVGTRVWQLLDGRALGAVIEVIVQEFEVSTERATEDVAAFVEQLVAVGAAEILAP